MDAKFAHLPTFPVGSYDWRMRQIAEWFDRAPLYGGHSDMAYRALIEETGRQFRLLTECFGIKVTWTDDDPYPDASALCADVDRGEMRVWTASLDGPFHPYLTEEERRTLRAVHDYFGHYRGRNRARKCHAFSARGELNAFLSHTKTLSGTAVSALATEVVGVNAWFAYGPYSHLPALARPWATPRAAAMPPSLWLPLVEDTEELRRLGSDPGIWSAQLERRPDADIPHVSRRASVTDLIPPPGACSLED